MSRQKYTEVQSWKAAHLPTLEIRVEQKGNLVMKCITKTFEHLKDVEKLDLVEYN